MNKRQFVALSLAQFVVYVIGGGALPLLPLYAAELGASPTLSGYYMASAYLAVTVGTLVSGWLSDRFGRRRALLALAGLLCLSAMWAMGRVGRVWALFLSTDAVWFLGGSGAALTLILAGILAGEGERGKVFGFLSLIGGVGSLAGGLIVGPMVDRWGYPTMFALLSLFNLLWPLAALILRDKRADQVIAGERSLAGRRLRLGTSFYLLLISNLMVAAAGFVGLFCRSLSMGALGFTATAVSSTLAVSSALALPLPLLVGWLSDHLGRKRFLVLSYLVSTTGLVLLSQSSALWHFWLAVALTGVGSSLRMAVGQALANDLLPRESLGRGTGLFTATTWFGAVIGFSASGNAVEHWGLAATLIGVAVLPLLAIGLLVAIRPARNPSD
jgi:MFS family permease